MLSEPTPGPLGWLLALTDRLSDVECSLAADDRHFTPMEKDLIMSAFENATQFFHACESLKGWEGCKQYVSPDAALSAQCEPLVDVSSVEAYTEWMAGLGSGPLAGCRYDLHSASYDEANKTATFFATFTATHGGEGGPVPPTGKETNTHYVYVLTMNDEGKIAKMCKVWNAPWALKELGWM